MKRANTILLIALVAAGAALMAGPALATTITKKSVTGKMPGLPQPGPSSTSCDGVQVRPGDDLQTIAEQSPPGSKFCINSGTYEVGSAGVDVDNGDRFVGVGSSPVLITTTSAPIIFDGKKAGSNVFAGLDISGAVGDPGCAPGCGRALSAGPDTLLRRSRLHGNYQAGIGGSEPGLIVQGSEIDHNGSADLLGCCSGGIKSANSFTVRRSFVHDNIGDGIWMDICGKRLIARFNIVMDNTRDGIRFESSNKSDCFDRSALIENNRVQGNNKEQRFANAGIQVRNSFNAVIRDNVLGNNGREKGILFSGPHGAGALVKHNVFESDNANCSVIGDDNPFDALRRCRENWR